jgi:hypothetical protein
MWRNGKRYLTNNNSLTLLLLYIYIHNIQAGMMAFVIGMCLALPVALLPQYLLYRAKLISKVRKEQWALRSGQFCARWMMRLIPFCKITTTPYQDPNPEPSIWVCNHTSQLDVFILLAADLKLRGKNKRPIKIVYVRIYNNMPMVFLCLSCLTHIVMSRFYITVETIRRQSNYQTLVPTMWFHSGSNGLQQGGRSQRLRLEILQKFAQTNQTGLHGRF